MPDPNVVYVAFGDSSTAGPAEVNYTDILSEKLEAPPDALANEGSGGETSQEGLERLRALLESNRYPNARVLLYWQGGNDIVDFLQRNDPLLIFSATDADSPIRDALDAQLDRMQANIEEAVRLGRAAALQVYVATYYPIQGNGVLCPAMLLDFLFPSQARRANEYMEQVNERIRLAAASAGALVIDMAGVAEELQSDPSNYFNCNHLSETGNEIVADVFLDAINATAD